MKGFNQLSESLHAFRGKPRQVLMRQVLVSSRTPSRSAYLGRVPRGRDRVYWEEMDRVRGWTTCEARGLHVEQACYE